MTHEIQTINAGHQLSVDSMRSHVAIIEEITKAVMQSGMHYGAIPGCGDKPTLLQPGAQKLALAFQLSIEPEIEWHDLPNGHREYHCKCKLVSRVNGMPVGTGVGNCSTMESRYRFRTQNTGAIVPQEYWAARDPEILGGRQYSPKKVDGQWFIFEKIEHDNPADYFNTAEKMAKKRAMVDAILTCTAASDHFTQDIEDAPELYGATGQTAPQQKPAAAQASKPQQDVQPDNDPIVQFGKHKGKKFSELPMDYLQWCVDNAQKDFVREAAQKEISRRTGQPNDQPPHPDSDKQDNTSVSSAAGKNATGIKTATEDQIRQIHFSLESQQLTMKEMLEILNVSSSAKIQAQDVEPILAWLKNPANKPPQLSAF